MNTALAQTTPSETEPSVVTVADLLHELGDISPRRVLMSPAPGTATATDLVRLATQQRRYCELVDATLVEKPVGHRESRLAMWLVIEIGIYLKTHPVGILAGPAAPHRLPSGQVRMPDVAYIPLTRIPSEADLNAPIVTWIPALAVEILSEGNTAAEMEAKCNDYLAAGVDCVWIADPIMKTVTVCHLNQPSVILGEADLLHGEGFLPGFTCSIREWMSSR